MPARGNLCPNCGKSIAATSGASSFGSWAVTAAASIILLAGGLMYFYFFHPRVEAEVSRVFSPLPKYFHIGIDVSASINRDALEKTKDVLVDRLGRFVGDEAVFYQISIFGSTGCGKKSISTLLARPSPENEAAFDLQVRKPVESINAASIAPRDVTHLTTPLYCFLETALTLGIGKRIVIFSDLMNDDSDCREQYIFPREAVERFGADKNSEIIFLYTSPPKSSDPMLNRRLLAYQKDFVDQMNTLANAGKIRVFFYHIPDDPLKSLLYIRKEMSAAIPSNILDAARDRLSRIFHAVFATLTE